MRISLSFAWLAAVSTAALASATDPLNSAIHRKLEAEGSWYTPAEAAFIRGKCGLRHDAEIRDIDIEGDVMTCNGRTVRDPRVKAIADDVSRRADARVRKVMNDPEVRAAIQRASQAAARRALAAPPK